MTNGLRLEDRRAEDLAVGTVFLLRVQKVVAFENGVSTKSEVLVYETKEARDTDAAHLIAQDDVMSVTKVEGRPAQ